MSYVTNLYIGWYAEFTPTAEKIQVGTKKKRRCTAESNHKHGDGKFCTICGAPVADVDVPVMNGISPASHFLDELDPAEVEYMTIGRATVEDLKELGDCAGIFPEFMPDQEARIERIMAPGYAYKADDGDGFVFEVKPGERPSQAWEAKINKIFGCTDLKVKFGIIKEII